MGEVAKALAVHPSTASNLVARLALRAMVASKREGKDRRTVHLYVTKKGLAALERAPKPLIGVLQQALADLPPRTVDALHRHLEELISVMGTRNARAQARAQPISEM